jgi:hypothetical protein
MPCSVCNIKCFTEGAYLKPLEGSSWIGYDTMFYNFFLCNWKTLVVLLIYLLVILLTLYILYKLNFISKNYSSPIEIYYFCKSTLVT